MNIVELGGTRFQFNSIWNLFRSCPIQCFQCSMNLMKGIDGLVVYSFVSNMTIDDTVPFELIAFIYEIVEGNLIHR